MTRTLFLSILGLLVLPLASCAPSSTSATIPTAVEDGVGADAITAGDMYARIYFLASDALRGRDTPSTGMEAAAAYLVSEHRRMGLEPAGESGTYYQRYPFTGRRGVAGAAPDRPVSYPPNVVAVFRGSHPQLRDEYVVLTAHFDHVGVGRPVDGDSVYNGADDNASGTAALLEVAKAFSTLPERPARSVIFLHVSGEEHGLIGSRYYSDNPTVPIGRIVANINADMIARNAPDSIVVIGKTYSTMGEVVERMGARHPELGLTVADDPWPQERFFYRSDHFNFARLEIPSLFFFSGVHEDYHQPSDTVDRIDPDKAARVAKLIFYTTQEIADSPARPTWDPAGLAEVRRLTGGGR
jgi:hypothetical protein